MDSSSSRLTVSRNLPSDIRQRQVFLSLDGQPWTSLVFGQTATRDLAPGPHRLRAHNTLVWKTIPFTVLSGEHAQFDVANRPGRWLLSALALLGVGPLFLTFERRPTS